MPRSSTYIYPIQDDHNSTTVSLKMHRRVLVFVIFCFVYALAKSCENAYNTLQRRIHDDRLRVMTDPIQDAAVLLSKESPGDPDALRFAHRLLRTHDNFTDICYDHHWLDSLAHKLCASFLRWKHWLDLKCEDVGNSAIGPGASVRCLCTGRRQLLYACSHHVLPWAQDESFCDQLIDQYSTHWNDCGHVHPFAGLCRMHGKKKPRGAKNQTITSATRHTTQPKHSCWSSSRKSRESVRVHTNIHDRIMEKQSRNRRSSRTRQIGGLLRESATKSNSSALYIGTLTLQTGHIRHGLGALFDPRLCDKYVTAGLRVCVTSGLPAMEQMLQWWAPGCRYFVDEGPQSNCDIQVGWIPSILRIYYNTPYASALFVDPRIRATRVSLRTDPQQAAWKLQSFKSAILEYTHETNTTCQLAGSKPNTTYHPDILSMLSRNGWFKC
jgi:hypothetical protein